MFGYVNLNLRKEVRAGNPDLRVSLGKPKDTRFDLENQWLIATRFGCLASKPASSGWGTPLFMRLGGGENTSLGRCHGHHMLGFAASRARRVCAEDLPASCTCTASGFRRQ